MDSDHCNWSGIVAITYIIWMNINCLEHVIDQVQYFDQFEDNGTDHQPEVLVSCLLIPPKHIRTMAHLLWLVGINDIVIRFLFG